jgi:FAD/FMN-containing dehydrogenase
MARILEIEAAAMIAVVQPGVLNVDVKNAARDVGLWYPPLHMRIRRAFDPEGLLNPGKMFAGDAP